MKDHCVINAVARNRTWEDEAGAIAHAQHILAKNSSKDGKLFVVKVVKVVELAPPPTNVRDPVIADMET